MKFGLMFLSFLPLLADAQLNWKNVDSLFAPLPPSVHIYYSNDSLDGKPNVAYYLEADLNDRHLEFTTAVGNGKRYTPSSYYTSKGKPLAVVNTTFFAFTNNSNLNVVIKEGKPVAYNIHSIPLRGKDTLTYLHPFSGAFGISKTRKADIAWTLTDSADKRVYAIQYPYEPLRDSSATFSLRQAKRYVSTISDGEAQAKFKKWKMETAFGGGPVLVQHGEIRITNNEERKFGGKAINDKHPRTTIGYTAGQKLVILLFEGRLPGKAEGATLVQAARVLKSLGCVEGLNLDGGGSSCLLVNGKETIRPSDKVQRPVPAVFIIKQKQ